ncbi:MAG TPA: 16S rRNA (cytidine(1402)-2'-O)-methyltransferase, partial [Candidatus Campbellbacteria bacterium]|nr:16S rRNA (cytidine(1402)-2'-O)-methyltransferase [Candidatus Campbellbacteria bacterium]
MDKGILYVVATPIGNLEDITLRALRILKEINLIACEDTRVARKLLNHFEIETPTVSYFQHSKVSKVDRIIRDLLAGKNVALITDAGT